MKHPYVVQNTTTIWVLYRFAAFTNDPAGSKRWHFNMSFQFDLFFWPKKVLFLQLSKDTSLSLGDGGEGDKAMLNTCINGFSPFVTYGSCFYRLTQGDQPYGYQLWEVIFRGLMNIKVCSIFSNNWQAQAPRVQQCFKCQYWTIEVMMSPKIQVNFLPLYIVHCGTIAQFVCIAGLLLTDCPSSEMIQT